MTAAWILVKIDLNTNLFFYKFSFFIFPAANLNKVGTSHLQEALEDLGGWPFLNTSWQNKEFDLTQLIGKINKVYGLETFLSLSVYANPKNTSENILTVIMHMFIKMKLIT